MEPPEPAPNPLPQTPVGPLMPPGGAAATPTPPPAQSNPVSLPQSDLITDVSKSTMEFIRHHYLRQFMLALGVAVAAELVFLLALVWPGNASANGSSSNNGVESLLFPPVLFSFWLARVKKRVEDAFIQQFAQINGFAYEKNGQVDEVYGTLFRLPGRQAVSDIVRGSYLGRPFTLFLFDRTINTGRNSHTDYYTVMEYEVAGQLPGLLLTPHIDRFLPTDMGGLWHADAKVELEGDFNQHYDVRVMGGDQIAAREIFTPDVMELIEERAGKMSIEWIANRLFLYHDGHVGNKADLDAMYNLAKVLGGKAGKTAAIGASGATLPEPVAVNTPRQPVQPWVLYLGLAAVILVFIWMVLTTWLRANSS